MKRKLFFTLSILCFLLWSPAPTHAQNAGFVYATNTIGNNGTGAAAIVGPFALLTGRSAPPPPPLRIAPGIRAALIDSTHCVANTSPQSVWFVSPTGAGSMNGSNPANAMTLTAAAQAAQIPSSGSAYVCLLGGRYELSSTLLPNHGGAPTGDGANQYIVYQAYGDGDVDIVWTGGVTPTAMIQIDSTSNGIGHPTPYLKFIGLNLDGMNGPADGFFCRQNDGMWFLGNVVSNTGGAGIGTQRCGYVFSDHNLINHNGYNPNASNTSGISYNQNDCTDNWDGLHFVISNNIIVGEIDQSPAHTDGNGIILDIQDNNLGVEGACTASGFTPPTALIMNNIVYGNGGQCIVAFDFQSYWVINNTCYTNDLNKAQQSGDGSIVSNSDGVVPTTNGYFVNNISYSWLTTNAPYLQEGSSRNIYYYNNLWWGPSGITCCSVPNWNNAFSGDPQFVNAPFFDPSLDGQYGGARPPSATMPTYIGTSSRCAAPWVPTCDITGAFALASSSSPAYNNGIDPTTNSFLSSQMTSDLMSGLRNFAGSLLPYPISIYNDINGKQRTAGTNWDLGALAH